MLERQVHNLFIGESRVGNGDSSRWVGCGQLPGRVHADYIEEAATMLHLLFAEFGEIVGHHIGLERHTVELALFFNSLDDLFLVVVL